MKVLVSWSSGKDSAWMLHKLKQDPAIEIGALLTTMNEAFDRVAMHAVRRTMLEAQSDAAGVPLWMVPLPWPCTNDEYEARMAEACRRATAAGSARAGCRSPPPDLPATCGGPRASRRARTPR